VTHRERFAPSPTGPLHLGHAYSAITAWNNAIRAEGEFLLRIEDIDQSRARSEWEALIYEDLLWLGLDWPKPVLRQSDRLGAYNEALNNLWNRGLLYACTCTRHDIQSALSAPQEGVPMLGADGLIYPGTCRGKGARDKAMPTDGAIRLDLEKAIDALDDPVLRYFDIGQNLQTTLNAQSLLKTAGDIVLARKNMGTSYHLSVVIDDAFQNITHVTRGKDLIDATPIHVLLQRLLDLPTPDYHHHDLIRDAAGKRLAKRDDAKAIRKYREDGATPQDIHDLIGLTPLERT